MTKKLNTTTITNELKGQSAFFKQDNPSPSNESVDKKAPHPSAEISTLEVTREAASLRDVSRDRPRTKSRNTPREKSRDLPTRNEIQEFSFRLRDELKVKVQAEVPHTWQQELETIARDLDVKKLELYRFILGEFLGKVKRKRSN
jgi:hypothetical protein